MSAGAAAEPTERWFGRLRVVACGVDPREVAALVEKPSCGEAVEGGRGGTVRVALSDGRRAYLRKCLRGGAVRHLVRDLYCGRPERPLREMWVTRRARSAGCLVPEILAVAIEYLGFCYRGWVLSEAIDGARALVDALAAAGPQEQLRLLARVSAAVAALHEAGVYHVDLTGHNVLVAQDGQIWLIDFDRARVGAPNSPRAIRRGRRRLWRSLVKLASARGMRLASGARELVVDPQWRRAVEIGEDR
ncbi:MAG: hypothetical protein D6815_09230 [Candidatus Dadabacteria bacterium]|nr:MAG: hypothetical protein D6815_09230 [Candidatus Dadabacteria bacterium]